MNLEPMTLQQLIAHVNSHKLTINNLFQTQGRWQSNLTDGDKYYEFGRGLCAFSALQDALEKALAAGYKPATPDLEDLF